MDGFRPLGIGSFLSEEKCVACNGSGWVTRIRTKWLGFTICKSERRCPNCGGLGLVGFRLVSRREPAPRSSIKILGITENEAQICQAAISAYSRERDGRGTATLHGTPELQDKLGTFLAYSNAS
jgi:hypothetical protein